MKAISVVSCWLLLVVGLAVAQDTENVAAVPGEPMTATAEIQSGTTPTYAELEKQLQEKDKQLVIKDNQLTVLKVKLLETRSECNAVKSDYDKLIAFFIVLLNDPRSKTEAGFLFSQINGVLQQTQ